MQVIFTQLNSVVSFQKVSKLFLLTAVLFMTGFSLKAQLTIVASDTALCLGDSVTLTVSGGTTYNWLNPINANGNTGAVIKAAPTNSIAPTEYVVVDPNTMDTGRIEISVSQLPFINVVTSADAEGRFICTDSSVTMTALAANSTYSWSPAATLNTATGPSVIGSPAVGTLYTVLVTDTNSGCSDTRDITISINNITPNVLVGFSGDSIICENDSTEIIVSGAGNGYQWFGSNIDDPTGNVVNVAPQTTETYTVVGRFLGCTSAEMITVEVLPAPNMSASATPAGPICLDGEKVVTVSGDPVVEYTWNFPTQKLTTTNTTQTVSPNVPGIISISITGEDANGCTNTISVSFQVDSCYNGPVPGFGEFALVDNINAYMGMDNQVMLTMNGSLNGTYNMRVVNLLGSEVFAQTIQKYDGQTSTHQIDLSNQASGLYILQMEDQTGARFAEKLIKQ